VRRAAFALTLLTACALEAAGQAGKADLRIVRPVVSQIEDGQPLGTATLAPGETAFFSFELENYKVGPNGEVRLTGHVQAFDPHGTPINMPDEIVIGTTISEEDKNWKPKLRSQVQIPPIAPAGPYSIRYDVTDGQSRSRASGEVKFNVNGRHIAPSAELAIRNLGFYRGQDEETPLALAAYRAGDMVWVKFDAVGYKYGEQNAIDVSYDVAVSASDGRQLFSQENAAVEKSQAFYPQPWVPGIFSLTLKAATQLGQYTLTITAHDGVGHQTATAKAPFKVE
jgi:hypothetical protein